MKEPTVLLCTPTGTGTYHLYIDAQRGKQQTTHCTTGYSMVVSQGHNRQSLSTHTQSARACGQWTPTYMTQQCTHGGSIGLLFLFFL